MNQFIIAPNFDAEWSERELEVLASEMHRVVDLYLERAAHGIPFRIAEFETTLADQQKTYCRTWGCHAGRGRIAVSVTGDLYPCARFVSGYPGLERFRLGSLDSGFSEVDTRMLFLRDFGQDRSKCSDCSIFDLCPGGCYSTNYHCCGSIYIPHNMECFYRRLTVELLERIESAGGAYLGPYYESRSCDSVEI
jgi:uncharacterized protein